MFLLFTLLLSLILSMSLDDGFRSLSLSVFIINLNESLKQEEVYE